MAVVDLGPDDNGVTTWVPTIVDTAGVEVFRDDEAYSTGHGIWITWLSTDDQLWVLSSDVGTARVDREIDGTWRKEWSGGRANLPSEIREIYGD